MNNNENNEIFSNDPLEHLKIENELLRLKMLAQFGDDFKLLSEGEVSPEIENLFLKQIIETENNFYNTTIIKIIEKIGIEKPRSSEGMTEAALTEALRDLEATMAKHGVFLDRIYGPYPDKIIYDFLVNEFLYMEVDRDLLSYISIKPEVDDVASDIENVVQDRYHFIYEEFHPNNHAEIEELTQEFMEHWQLRNFDENDVVFCSEMVAERGNQIPRAALYRKMYQFFDSFTAFENFEFRIGDIQFADQGDNLFMGHSEGPVRYDAVMENGEKLHYNGVYKLYMIRDNYYWSIIYFVMEGFSWDKLIDK